MILEVDELVPALAIPVRLHIRAEDRDAFLSDSGRFHAELPGTLTLTGEDPIRWHHAARDRLMPGYPLPVVDLPYPLPADLRERVRRALADWVETDLDLRLHHDTLLRYLVKAETDLLAATATARHDLIRTAHLLIAAHREREPNLAGRMIAWLGQWQTGWRQALDDLIDQVAARVANCDLPYETLRWQPYDAKLSLQVSAYPPLPLISATALAGPGRELQMLRERISFLSASPGEPDGDPHDLSPRPAAAPLP